MVHSIYLFLIIGLSIFTMVAECRTVSHNLLNSENDLYYQQSSLIFQMAKTYPTNFKYLKLGLSVQNRDMLAMVISGNVTQTEDGTKTKLNLMGMSTAGNKLLMKFGMYLLQNMNKSDIIGKVLKETDIYILPTINPDKLNQSSLSCEHEFINSNNISLMNELNNIIKSNNTLNGHVLQPETNALLNFFNKYRFDLLAVFDSGDLNVYIPPPPPSTSPSSSSQSSLPSSPSVKSIKYDDYIFLRELGNSYKESHSLMKLNHPCSNSVNSSSNILDDHKDNINNNINNYNYNNFLIDNSSALHIPLAVKMSIFCCSQINDYNEANLFELNRESLNSLLQRSLMVIKGSVLNDVTKQPIPGAIIRIGQTILYSDGEGKFKKLLPSGFYKVEAYANNYKKVVLSSVYIASTDATRINIYLSSLTNERQSNISKLVQAANDMKMWSYIVEDVTNLRYMNYEEMTKMLNDTVGECRDVMRMYSVGQSVRSRELWVVEISKNPGNRKPGMPAFKYIANMHGNEAVGRVLLLYFIKLICNNYKKSTYVDLLLELTDIHIMPSMNPDGYEISREGDADSIFGRANAHNIDLNRNFPKRLSPNQDANNNNSQEVETKSVMAWCQSIDFVLSANLHGGTLVANYPYDDSPDGSTTYTKSPDDVTFRMLASSYAQAHPYMHLKPQCGPRDGSSFDGGITNGAAWYSISGGMQDWNYLNTNCFEITLEVSCIKFPLTSELKSYWDANKEPLFDYLIQVHKGVRGFTVDKHTGKAIAGVTIFVGDINHDVVSTSSGEFWRILSPGKYKITAAKLNYKSESQMIEVTDGASTFVMFHMEDVGPTAWFHTWSVENDFNKTDNTELEYLNADSIYKVIEEMAIGMDTWIRITGVGPDNKPLLLVNISSNEGSPNKDNVLIISQLDGEQKMGSEMMMRFMRHLVYGLKSSNEDKISSLLKTHRLLLMPLIRPKHHVNVVNVNNNVNDDGCVDDQASGVSLEFRDDGRTTDDGQVDTLKRMLVSGNVNIIISLETGYVDLLSSKNDSITNLVRANISRSYPSILTSCSKQDRPSTTLTNNHSMLNYVKKHFNNITMYSLGLHCCKLPHQSEVVNVYARVLKPLFNLIFFSTDHQEHWPDDVTDITDLVHHKQHGVEEHHQQHPSLPSSLSLPVIIGLCCLVIIFIILLFAFLWRWKQREMSPWKRLRQHDIEDEFDEDDDEVDDLSGFRNIKLNEYKVIYYKNDDLALVKLQTSESRDGGGGGYGGARNTSYDAANNSSIVDNNSLNKNNNNDFINDDIYSNNNSNGPSNNNPGVTYVYDQVESNER